MPDIGICDQVRLDATVENALLMEICQQIYYLTSGGRAFMKLKSPVQTMNMWGTFLYKQRVAPRVCLDCDKGHKIGMLGSYCQQGLYRSKRTVAVTLSL